MTAWSLLPIGTHVVGVGPGTFAQYMTMPAAGVRPVPSGWSDAEALGLVLNWATAVAVVEHAEFLDGFSVRV
jgi:NADPH:quinone reductase-like Zn-dependent oxidoreductase